MIVDIQTRRLRTIGQLRAFVDGNEAARFQVQDRDEVYGFVRETLIRFDYATRQPGQGRGIDVSGRRDQRLAPADGAPGSAVARDREDPRPAWGQPWPAVRAQVHGGGHPLAGGSRRGLRADVGAGHARGPAAPIRSFPGCAVRASRDALERAHLQPARLRDVSRQAYRLEQDAGGECSGRAAPSAGTRRSAWVCARGHRPPRRSGRGQGPVPDQLGRRDHPVSIHRRRSRYLAALPGPATGGPAVVLSVRDPRFPRRQWQRVHQPPGRRAARKAKRGDVHQVARPAFERQCPGRE